MPSRRALPLALLLLAPLTLAVGPADAAPSRSLLGGSSRVDGAQLQPATATRLDGAQLLGRVNTARASAGLAPLLKAPAGRIELSVLRLFVPEAPENNLSLSWATRVQASDAAIPFAFAQFTPVGAPAAIPGVANLHVKLAPGKLHVVDCRVEARVDQVIQFRFTHGTTSSVVSLVDGHVFAAFKAPPFDGPINVELAAVIPDKKPLSGNHQGWYFHGCEITPAE
ncbi:MAG: hypothetical protein R3A79_23920 [Nannocystaceae bacterium]